MDGYVRIVLIALLTVLYAAFGTPGWMLSGGAPYAVRAIVYPFFHASWWHLAVNALAIWTIYRPGRCKPCRDLLIPYIISCIVYPLSLRPVIGISNVIYAALGMRTPPLSSPWWKQSTVIIFLVVTVALIFVPQFSATTHIAAFALGMAGASVSRWYNKLLKDVRRFVR